MCPVEGVRIEPGVDDAAMGLRVATVRMINCGTGVYRVNGYPAVKVVGGETTVRHGSAGIAVVDGFDAPPAPVVLQPGEIATTGLMWRNTVTDVNTPPTVGSGVDVAPLPGKGWQRVTMTIDLGTTGELGVRAWTKP